MLTDRYDLPLSTPSPAARDAYVEGVDLLLSANAGADAALDRAIAADETFALAHAARARWLQIEGRAAQAREAASRAAVLAHGVGRRERQHIEILSRVVRGEGPAALDLTRAHVAEFPRDTMALAPSTGVFGLIGFSGRRGREAELLALLEPLAPHYGEDWWFLTVHAFARIETGQRDEGRRLVERALALHPRNAHAAHVFVHALYEGGHEDETVRYLEPWLAAYPRSGQLHCHLWWHLAVAELAESRAARMWEIYTAQCRPEVSASPPINVLTDGASLLWRAELAGERRDPGLWRSVREYAASAFPRPGVAFADVHCALASAASGDVEGLGRLVEELREADRAGRLPAGPVLPALAEAAGAFARGDWALSIAIIEPALDEIVRIGGSRAQRDLFEHTLLAACLQAGRPEAARAVVARRHDRAPSVVVAGWPAMRSSSAPGSVTVRPLGPDDKGEALAVINESARWYREFLPPAEYHEPEMTAEAWDEEARRMTWYGAFVDGRLVGVMGLEACRDAALLRHAYVLPGAQRHGMGTRLLEALETEIGRWPLQPQRIIVGTYAGNYKARQALEKAGYRPSPDPESVLRAYYAIPEDRLRSSVTYEKPPAAA